MKKYLLAFFTYSSREKRGILALMLLIASLNLLFEGYAIFYKKEEPISIQVDTINLASFLNEEDSPKPLFKKQEHSQQLATDDSKDFNTRSLFPFDPNSATLLDWQRLGLSLRQATGIVHYLEKGGRYRVKSDLKKMYGMTESLYVRLEPYIQLPDSVSPSPRTVAEAANKLQTKSRMLELNTADSMALLDLPGIGPWFSFRIINYRQRLGGFVRKDQLLEVRGIDSTRYSQLSALLTVDPFEVQKINVNKASVEELGHHPYIGYLLAKMIVNFRLQHGNFKRIDEIKALPLVDADLYSKLAPYLFLTP